MGKPRVIVLTYADLVPKAALEETIQYIKASEKDRGVPVVAVDAQRGGEEIEELRLECMKAGAYVNRRRKRKGVNPRAIRTIMLGFPNVGKSSIINRLTNRKVAGRTGWAGTTKKMTWHHIGGFRNTELAFLDAPGNIPFGFAKRYTKEQQALLCMCRIFGDKIIDREQTAFDLVYLLGKLAKDNPQMLQQKTLWKETRRIYGVDFQAALRLEVPFFPNFVPADNPEPFCGKLLNDFNRGFWGKHQLEAPPEMEERRENWSHVYGDQVDRRAQKENISGAPIALAQPFRSRGLLGPPAQVHQTLPDQGLRKKFENKREKLPVFVDSRPQRRQDEGLFDGW